MRFGPIPVREAEGKILGHNVAGPDGRRALRKGKALTKEDLATLAALGRQSVYVARLEPGDVDENQAALRVAQATMGEGLRLSGPAAGRVNLFALVQGVFRVDVERLAHLNHWEGLTVATLPGHTAVREGKMVATVKVLPYGLAEDVVTQAGTVAAGEAPLLQVDALVPRRVGLILSGSTSARQRIVRSFETALQQRLELLNAGIEAVEFIPLEEIEGERELADTIGRQLESGLDLIILAGETAIMDRHDIAPRAVERAGGQVTCYGAPVDPGNLLMLAYAGPVPIMGAPGCARSPKTNIVDLLLPRLLAGDRLERADVVRYGHGGLLEDVPERPMPRSRID